MFLILTIFFFIKETAININCRKSNPRTQLRNMTAPTPSPVVLTDEVFDEPGLFTLIVRPTDASEENIRIMVVLTSRVSRAWWHETVLTFRDAVWRTPFDQRLAVFRDSIEDASHNIEFDRLIRGMNMYRGLFNELSVSSGETCEESLAGLFDIAYYHGSTTMNTRMVAAGVLESVACIMYKYPISDALGVCLQRNCVALLYEVLRLRANVPTGFVARAGDAAIFGRVASTMMANRDVRELLMQGVTMLHKGSAYWTPDCVYAVIAFMRSHRSDFTGNVEELRAWRDAQCLLSSLLATPDHLGFAGGSDISCTWRLNDTITSLPIVSSNVFYPSVTATHSLVVGQGVVEMVVGGLYALAAMPEAHGLLLLKLWTSVWSCTVIAQIAAVLDDAVTQSIVAAGGVRALLVLLTSPRLATCIDVKWLHQSACVALEFLCSSGATVRQRVADEGGVAALEHVLVWHVLEPSSYRMIMHEPTPLCVERAEKILHELRALGVPAAAH